jgi:hypothetical protein
MEISARDGRWNKTALNVLQSPARDIKGGVTLEMVRTGDNRWRDRNEVSHHFEAAPDRVVEPARPMEDSAVCQALGASRHQTCSKAYLAARDLTAEILGQGAALDFEV